MPIYFLLVVILLVQYQVAKRIQNNKLFANFFKIHQSDTRGSGSTPDPKIVCAQDTLLLLVSCAKISHLNSLYSVNYSKILVWVAIEKQPKNIKTQK